MIFYNRDSKLPILALKTLQSTTPLKNSK